MDDYKAENSKILCMGIIVFKDSTVELYSRADTLYRYTYSLQNDVRKKNTKNKISLLKVICCPNYRKNSPTAKKQSNTRPHMKRDSIFLLILLLSLCCCSQKKQQAETVKNDSITEFFRNFYTGCNEYFVQIDKADRDNKSDSYRLYLTDKFISFLKDFCYDDIVAEAYNYDLDIYGRDGIDSLNDSNLQSLHVEKMANEKNAYIVHLQMDTTHIQRLYTLAKQDGKMKIYAIGKRKHPMIFRNDTLRIADCPKSHSGYYHWHGFTISNYYSIAESMIIKPNCRVAVLTPYFENTAAEPLIYSDRLLVVEYKNRKWVYNNVISNQKYLAGWTPYETLVKTSEDAPDDFLERSDFLLSYSAGMGYKIYYTLGVKAIENELYLTGYKWEEHDSGLLFRKQIIQEYDGTEMPLATYRRYMPWELRLE